MLCDDNHHLKIVAEVLEQKRLADDFFYIATLDVSMPCCGKTLLTVSNGTCIYEKKTVKESTIWRCILLDGKLYEAPPKQEWESNKKKRPQNLVDPSTLSPRLQEMWDFVDKVSPLKFVWVKRSDGKVITVRPTHFLSKKVVKALEADVNAEVLAFVNRLVVNGDNSIKGANRDYRFHWRDEKEHFVIDIDKSLSDQPWTWDSVVAALKDGLVPKALVETSEGSFHVLVSYYRNFLTIDDRKTLTLGFLKTMNGVDRGILATKAAALKIRVPGSMNGNFKVRGKLLKKHFVYSRQGVGYAQKRIDELGIGILLYKKKEALFITELTECLTGIRQFKGHETKLTEIVNENRHALRQGSYKLNGQWLGNLLKRNKQTGKRIVKRLVEEGFLVQTKFGSNLVGSSTFRMGEKLLEIDARYQQSVLSPAERYEENAVDDRSFQDIKFVVNEDMTDMEALSYVSEKLRNRSGGNNRSDRDTLRRIKSYRKFRRGLGKKEKTPIAEALK